jgi:ATP-dependent DNA helicase RecG
MTGHKLTKESKQRIDLMCSTQDGFELAEADMRMRGPGDIEGTQQSGLPVDLHISDLAKDSQILEDARNTAMALLEDDPLLEKPENYLLRTGLSRLRREVKDFSQIS